MLEEVKKKEDSLKERMCFIFLNKSICLKKEGLIYMDKIV